MSDPVRARTLRRRRLGWLCLIPTLALVSGWAALALLARVTPALFPGQQLTAPVSVTLPVPVTIPVIDHTLDQTISSLPSVLKIESPGPESVFNRPIVLLIAGVDTRPGVEGELAAVNTDTIMLANVDPVAKDVKLLSIPRDLLIEIQRADGTSYEDRVNASFAAGAASGGGVAAGMAQLADDLERGFDLDIDYWVQLDFRGAALLLDAIGGVDIEIPEDLAAPRVWYSDDDRNARWLEFPAGSHHLDGYEAVAFSRLREFDDDFHRMRRQQLVLEAAIRQVFAKGMLQNPLSLWETYGDAIRTNVPAAKLPGYALLLRQTDGRMTAYSLSDPVNGVATVYDVHTRRGAAVLRGRPENMAYWVDQFLGTRIEPAPPVAAASRGEPLPDEPVAP